MALAAAVRVFITGHRGFVGRHFYRHLKAEGHDVRGVDTADPVNPRDCRDAFRNWGDQQVDLVIHCAAIVGGREMIDGNPLKVADNLSIDAEMFQWAMRTKPKRVVYFSSSAAYPIHLQSEAGHRLTEDDIDLQWPMLPDQTYGWAKLTGEVLAHQAQCEGLPVTVLRPFSGYGEDQSLDYPFPSFAERARNHDDPFEVWGDGTQVRDWIHIDDIVGATMAALHFGIEGPINLGWGEPVLMGELVMMMAEAASYVPEIQCLTEKPTGVGYRVADATKMLSFYAPKVSLEEGVARSVYQGVAV